MKLISGQRKKLLLSMLAMVVFWKLLMIGVGYFGSYKIGLGPTDTWSGSPTIGLLKHTFKYDSGWYAGIAETGYKINKSAPAFYPLFPGLLSLGRKVTGLDLGVIAFILNSVATYVAAVFLFLIAKDIFSDTKKAYFAVLAFLFFPTSYFLHAMYGEAIFCALSFGAYYMARRQRWLLSGVLLGFLTASRLPALLMVLTVLVEYLDQKDFDVRKIKKDSLFLLIAPVGIIAYSLHLAATVGDPFAMVRAYNYGEWAEQKLNFNMLASAWTAFKDTARLLLRQPPGWQALSFDLGTALLAWFALLPAFIIAVKKKMPISLTVYIASTFVLLGIHTTFVSSQRYLLVVFPIYLLIAGYLSNRSEHIRLMYVATSGVLMAMLYMIFINGIWTA